MKPKVIQKGNMYKNMKNYLLLLCTILEACRPPPKANMLDLFVLLHNSPLQGMSKIKLRFLEPETCKAETVKPETRLALSSPRLLKLRPFNFDNLKPGTMKPATCKPGTGKPETFTGETFEA